MDYHLNRDLRFLTEPKHKSLYSWAIQEIDAHGKQIGEDQIPWPWTLYFTAKSCTLLDNFEVETERQSDGAAQAPPKITERQHIRILLDPGHPSHSEDYETTFSMLGTDRVIKSFDLNIYPITNPAEQESCSAWGSVSYTAELDFREETSDDCVIFYLFVKPDTFARYGAKIAHGLVSEIIFSVGSVAGFYSEWSPSISTGNVKVLTGDQEIKLPPNIELPRLGYLGKVELYINRRIEFSKREPEAVTAAPVFGTEQVAPRTPTSAVVDPRVLQMMASLKRAGWSMVCLLALIFVVVLLRAK